MDQSGLLALYTYNAYANKLVLDTAAQLTADELVGESSPSHGSVHRLLVHMLACEAYFLTCCQGRLLPFDPGQISTLDDIRRHWQALEQEQQSFIASLGADDLARMVHVDFGGGRPTLDLPAWQLLMQAFLHSTHHRGELSIVLTGLGYPLPTLDIILHFIEQSGQEWPVE
ncbi:MAG: DinB family protein [Anaerolineae bacterium]|nr:DinB family protein [Anaerolineae bacterium]